MLYDFISAAPVVTKDTVALWIAVASAISGGLLVLTQIYVSVAAAHIARTAPKTEEKKAGAQVLSATTLQSLLVNTNPEHFAALGTALETEKTNAETSKQEAETRANALDLLKQLSGTIPLAVGGILLFLIAAIVNGSLGASLIFGNPQ